MVRSELAPFPNIQFFPRHIQTSWFVTAWLLFYLFFFFSRLRDPLPLNPFFPFLFPGIFLFQCLVTICTRYDDFTHLAPAES